MIILLQIERQKILDQLEFKMSSQNNYIPEYIPDDLPWYERDELMKCIDNLKCDKFLENPDEHFKKANIINFDRIHRQTKREKIPDENLKKYQTVQHDRVKKYPKKDQNNFLSSVFFILKKKLSITTFLKDVKNNHS